MSRTKLCRMLLLGLFIKILSRSETNFLVNISGIKSESKMMRALISSRYFRVRDSELNFTYFLSLCPGFKSVLILQ